LIIRKMQASALLWYAGRRLPDGKKHRYACGRRMHDQRLCARQRHRCDEPELPPVVATDCVGDRALGPHQANLLDMGQKYSDLMSGKEIMHALTDIVSPPA
jgi:hypothetical protein